MKWLIKLVSKIKWPYKRKVTFDELTYFRNSDLKGCLIACHTPWQLTNLFIKGWDHIEIVAGPDSMIGAVSKGVRITEIWEVLSKCDHYLILKPTKPVNRHKVVEFAYDMAVKNIPYDYKYDEANDAEYCSELAVDSYNSADYGLDYGRFIYPQELVDDVHNFKKIKEFRV